MINLQHSAGQDIHEEHIEIPIGGMSCGGCAQTVQQALSGLTGVMHASVSHAEAKAHIHYAPDQVSVKQLTEAIIKAGYQAGEPLATGNPAPLGEAPAGRSCCCAKK